MPTITTFGLLNIDNLKSTPVQVVGLPIAQSRVVTRFPASLYPQPASPPPAMPSDDAPDFRDGAINVNLVLRWEFRPGSTILGVYTHAQGQTAFDPTLEGFGRPSITRFSGGAATDLFLLKLSLLLI